MMICVCLALVLSGAPGGVLFERERMSASVGRSGEKWQISDWRGRALQDGRVDSEGHIPLGEMPCGYYFLDVGTNRASIAVMPRPERRVPASSSFYAVDSAQSWISAPGKFDCPWHDGDSYRLISDLIRRAGIPHVRERMRWADTNPKPDVFEWGRYMRNAELLRQRNVAISGVFHDAASWTRGPRGTLPRDLVALYRFCRQAARDFGGRMEAWEFWNEEEISVPDPAWDYGAAMKAAALGFKSGNPRGIVLNGAFVETTGINVYKNVFFANDLARYTEAFNLHTYKPLSAYPNLFADIRELLKGQGVGNRAIWVTESGTHIEGPALAESGVNGVRTHSPEQELVQAEFYAKSQVLLQMEGVCRNYFFVFGAYNEWNGGKDWGVIRRNGTVKPVYAAISTMIRELGTARLAGEVFLQKGVRAYLFNRSDGSQTLVYWVCSEVDTESSVVGRGLRTYDANISVRTGPGRYRTSDMCGIQGNVVATNDMVRLLASRFPSYVSGLHGFTPSVRPISGGVVQPMRYNEGEDLTVVIRVDVNPEDFSITDGQSTAEIDGDFGRLHVEFWNLSGETKNGRPVVSGGELSGLPDEIVLGPWGHIGYDVRYRPKADGKPEDMLVVSGVFEGRKTSRFAMRIRQMRKMLSGLVPVSLDADDPKYWTRNASASSLNVSLDEAENAVRFDAEWRDPKVNRWFYPVYDLKLPKEGLSDAKMIEFEVKSTQDKVENDFSKAFVMLVAKKGSGSDVFLTYDGPMKNWEKRRVVLPDGTGGLNLKDVSSIRIGANPKGQVLVFWIRNLKILKKTK